MSTVINNGRQEMARIAHEIEHLAGQATDHAHGALYTKEHLPLIINGLRKAADDLERLSWWWPERRG